jgi:hypothetical protein
MRLELFNLQVDTKMRPQQDFNQGASKSDQESREPAIRKGAYPLHLKSPVKERPAFNSKRTGNLPRRCNCGDKKPGHLLVDYGLQTRDEGLRHGAGLCPLDSPVGLYVGGW